MGERAAATDEPASIRPTRSVPVGSPVGKVAHLPADDALPTGDECLGHGLRTIGKYASRAHQSRPTAHV